MSLHVKDAGVWKTATPYVKNGGAWLAVQQMYVRDAGVWKLVFQAGPSFSPDPGSYNVEDNGSVGFAVSASQNATWTYTKSLSVTADRASGSVATGIFFSVTASTTDRAGWVELTATIGGQAYNWSVNLMAFGNA